MVFVKCDLCIEQELFDPTKVIGKEAAILDIIEKHICKKPEKKPAKRKFLPAIKQYFREYEFGSRRERLGPDPDEEES